MAIQTRIGVVQSGQPFPISCHETSGTFSTGKLTVTVDGEKRAFRLKRPDGSIDGPKKSHSIALGSGAVAVYEASGWGGADPGTRVCAKVDGKASPQGCRPVI